MEFNLLITFIIFNVLNVIIQTIKSIATIKCGKWGAAIINAVAYGLYTYVIIYTMCDLPIFLKAFIVALANLVGVYVVKLIEEKSRKDKLWKIEMSIPNVNAQRIASILNQAEIPFSYIENLGKYTLFNVYCSTQEQSSSVKGIVNKFGAKYFVSESKNL